MLEEGLHNARVKVHNLACQSAQPRSLLDYSHLLAVTGSRIGVATRRAAGTPANVGRPRYCVSVLGTEFTLVVWLAEVPSCQTPLTSGRAGLRVAVGRAGRALVGCSDGEGILGAKFNVGVIIRGLVTGGGSLAHWGTVGVRVLALAGARVASCCGDTHRG